MWWFVASAAWVVGGGDVGGIFDGWGRPAMVVTTWVAEGDDGMVMVGGGVVFRYSPDDGGGGLGWEWWLSDGDGCNGC
ncbi:hypothetical protein Tco_1571385 [Tanacetum coccineum]